MGEQQGSYSIEWRGYAAAVVAAAIATAASWYPGRFLEVGLVYGLFAFMVILVAYRFGAAPGAVATFLCAGVLAYFYERPLTQWRLTTPALARICFFIFEGLAISILCQALLSARRRAEAQVIFARHSEELHARLAAIVESSDDAIIGQDLDGRVVSWNRAAERMYGYTEAEALGRNVMLLRPPDRHDEEPELSERFLENQRIAPYETIRVAKDGRRVDVSISVSPIRNAEGRIIGAAKIARDITQRKRDEEERHGAERRLAAEHAVTRILVSAATLEEAAPQMLKVLCEAAEACIGEIWLPDGENAFLRSAGIWISSQSPHLRAFEVLSRQMSFRHGAGLPGRVWQSGQPAVISDLAADSNFPRREVALSSGLHSGFAFPIRVVDDFYGVIELFTDHPFKPDATLLRMLSAVGQDIAQFIRRRHAEAQVQRLNRDLSQLVSELQTVLSALPVGVAIAQDPVCQNITFNPALANLLEIDPLSRISPRGAESQTPPYQFFSGGRPLCPHELPMQRAAAAGASVPWTELAVELVSGKTLDLLVNAVPLFDDVGKVRGCISVSLDITQRKRVEAELKAANDAKDHFLAALSHELRTPLTPVVMTLSVLRATPGLPPQMVEDLEMIRRNVELETKLIDDLLDLTRVERGKLELHRRIVDIHSLIHHAVRTCQDDPQKQLTVSFNLSADEHHVIADPARLGQVLFNVVRNALKFTPSGGRIDIATRNISPGQLELEIADTGIGIDPQALPRIFNAFEQGGRGITRQFGGLGLGLAIAKAIVDLHGGSIMARSAGAGQGAVFSIVLATVHAPSDPPVSLPLLDSPEAAATVGAGTSARRLQILVVDDHPPTLSILSRLLRGLNHDVQSAIDVSSAKRLASTQRFDLLLSDLGLPDGSGLELMDHLRQQYGIKGIALSGYGREDDVRRSILAGFAQHLVKPVSLEALESAIARIASGGEVPVS